MTVTLVEQRAAAFKDAQALIEKVKAGDEPAIAQAEAKVAEVKALDVQIARAAKGAELIDAIGGMAPEEKHTDPAAKQAGSLGEHFVKHAGNRLKDPGTIAVPEFKAATDNQVTGGPTGAYGPLLTDVDPNVVTGYRRPLAVLDLLAPGTIAGQAITYFVEGAMEGAFGWVAEVGQKPQLHQADPTPVTDTLKEIAGWTRFSDSMVDDLDFIVSEINNRLLYLLALAQEQAVLAGDGTGSSLTGLLNRSGIQTETADDADDLADAIFRATTKIPLATGLQADGIVINPADYQSLRLSRDANGQYFGGGFFAGQYGNGTIDAEPPLWGRRTVVTPAIAAGTVLVGAYRQAATLYRKGGVRVEWTNSHADDFTNDRVVVRAKERLALAVRQPAAFVEVTVNTP